MDRAAHQLSVLAARGFGGFTISGNQPFRVVRTGLTRNQANALIQALAGADVSAFERN
jgi:hypothetical protein